MRARFNLDGKVALVTGGSRGLGRAIALGFAEHGATVVVASRKHANCELVANEIRGRGGTAAAIAAHVGKWGEIERLVDSVLAMFGTIDILVNNAGISPTALSSSTISEELFDKIVAVNFKGPFRLAALCGSKMVEGSGGSIINISSIGSIRPKPDYATYAGAKAALNAITTAHAFEFAPKVRVNAILPGSFRTDIAKHWPPEKEKAIDSAIKRYGEPDEIVSTALYLADDSASFTTGSLIRVDGGRP